MRDVALHQNPDTIHDIPQQWFKRHVVIILDAHPLLLKPQLISTMKSRIPEVILLTLLDNSATLTNAFFLWPYLHVQVDTSARPLFLIKCVDQWNWFSV